MKEMLKAYRARWQVVAEIEHKELQNATLELRWQQLNSIVGIAIGLGLNKPSEDEIEVFQPWVKLKEKADSQKPAILRHY
jgi:hypothetical protein